MELKQLIQDEDAVSPVIGVILMVAITVILAAVIGTFVLGLGDQVQSSAPNTNFQFEYDEGATTVTITHNGGQDVEQSTLSVEGAGISLSGSSGLDTPSSGSAYSTGDTIISGVGYNTGETIRVIWSSPSGGSSNTIGESTTPA